VKCYFRWARRQEHCWNRSWSHSSSAGSCCLRRRRFLLPKVSMAYFSCKHITYIYRFSINLCILTNAHCKNPSSFQIRSLMLLKSNLSVIELRRPADTQARRWLCSASSTSLDVRHTRLSTVSDRAFPVAVTRLWNSLPSHVTVAPLSLHLLLSS